MDKTTRTNFDNLFSSDPQTQYHAFQSIIAATDKPVDWAYEVWDRLVQGLTDKDNHVRAISGQVLANLAKSDPKNRMKKTFPALLNVTRDARFVTARHTMQNIWKVGAVGKSQQKTLLDGLSLRFNECISEKNCTLIRYDINVALHDLYKQVKDEKIKAAALKLNETETDAKYAKKYATVWR